MNIIEQSAELLWITPRGAKAIEAAGRTCYKSEDKITSESADGFIRRLRQNWHMAMLEHASASYRLITDRGISHEIIRHRLASYAQESTRYCNYGKEKFNREITVIRPPGLDKTDTFIWSESVSHCEAAYFELLDQKMPPQIARSVLPTCLKTEIVVTANFREWLHIFDLRCKPNAHPQIQELMGMVQDDLKSLEPYVFGDLGEENAT